MLLACRCGPGAIVHQGTRCSTSIQKSASWRTHCRGRVPHKRLETQTRTGLGPKIPQRQKKKSPPRKKTRGRTTKNTIVATIRSKGHAGNNLVKRRTFITSCRVVSPLTTILHVAEASTRREHFAPPPAPCQRDVNAVYLPPPKGYS